MPNYFDPIMQEELVIEESTIVYIVKIGDDAFCLKALSSGLEHISSDPTTHAEEYWPIPARKLLTLTANENLFHSDTLSSTPLKKSQIIEYFGFDPDTTETEKFDRSLKDCFANEWAEQTMHDMLQEEAMHIPFPFFFQPAVPPNPDAVPAPELGEQQAAAIVLMFTALPQEGDQEDVPLPSFMMFIPMGPMEPPVAEREEEEERQQTQGGPTL